MMVMALSLRVRHRCFEIYSHPGGAYYMSSAFCIGNMPNVSSANTKKQLLVHFAGRHQSGRGVIIQSEENAWLRDADHIKAVEVWCYSVFGVRQLLGERHESHLAGRVRSDRI